MPIAMSQYPASFDLSNLNGVNGFTLNGINPSDQSGYSVASAGDVNGDGMGDLIIGAPYANNQAGQSYVVFGRQRAWTATLSLVNLDGTDGFALNGIKADDQSGYSVASAGDVNGDGLSDLIIGAPNANHGGQSYVVFGSRASWPAQFYLQSLNGTNGFVLNGIFVWNGINPDDQSGYSVASAGDVNGDSIVDLIIGTPGNFNGAWNADNAGQSYVVFGSRASWPAQFNLQSLNGTNGFTLNGVNAGTYGVGDLSGSGTAVTSAGDVNGDGIADLIIGAPAVNYGAGQSYVVFGSRNVSSAAMNLSALDGTNGFALNGVSSDVNDQSGTSVASAGDVNGDGIADLIIGAPQIYNNEISNSGAGQSYVVFGSRGAWPAQFSLQSLNGTNGFMLNGIKLGDESSWSVASAGDVNGDGLSDLIIGAPNANHGGQSYVVFGSGASWPAQFNLQLLNGTNGFILNGISSVDLSGTSVASAGDVNGDGVADLIVGAPGANYDVGQSYVVFGGKDYSLILNQLNIMNGGSTLLSVIDLSIKPNINTTLFSVNTLDHGQFEQVDNPGMSITNFTELELCAEQIAFYHDGTNIPPNYAIACSNSLSAIAPQSAEINFTSAENTRFSQSYSLALLTGTNGFTLDGINSGDQSGISVASAGDVNGDGMVDLIIGALNANNGAGQSYVVFGSRASWPDQLSLQSLNGVNGFTLNGINSGDNSGTSVASAGDVNGDGIADLIIGAPNANNDAGQSYIVFGSRASWPAPFNLRLLNGTNGFTLNGIYLNDYFGSSVASAGDINGDGIDDLIIGAPYANNNAGQSYVVFGSRASWPAQFYLQSLNGTNGFILNGINEGNPGDKSGSSVASAGDVNGDGITDLIIGAPTVNYGGGQSYVVFGSRNVGNAAMNLSGLDGINGFILNTIWGKSGASVASAGDVNGDGLSDLIIGAPNANNGGQSYVVFGSRASWPAQLYLQSLNGTNGFTLNGISSLDSSGYSVASAGDVNGDGLSDLIIGAPNANNGGQSYVVFGSRHPWNEIFNLSSLNGANGFILNGINTANTADQSGNSVSSAGDVNGDGIADLIIGAPQPYNNNGAGQSYVVFGSYQFLQLASNQLKVSNGQSVTVDSTILSIRSFSYSRELVKFSISNITNGWFESTNGNYCSNVHSSVNSITAFTQAQIDAGEIVFVHDGSSNKPSYSVSFATSAGLLGFSEPQPANINFVTYLSIDTTGFTVNQYANQFNLTRSNILANYNLSSDPAEIIFTVNEADHGWFANVNKTKTSLNTFKKLDINQGQICFYSPCGVNDIKVLPSFTLTATAPDGLITAQTTGTVLYNPAPVITQNAITIGEKQIALISQANIAASDVNSSSVNNTVWYNPDIVFTVSVTGGHFQYVGGQSNISSFTQANISDHQVEFVSNAMTAPSYNITATDYQGATSLPQAGQVTFQQSSSSSTNSAVTSTIAASVAIGGVAAAGLGLFLLNRRNNNRLHAYIERSSNKDNSLNKIAEVIFEKIKLTGFLNHIQKNRVIEYVNAIKEILESLAEMSFPVDLSTMTEKSRNHFLEEFPRQIKAAFPVSQQSRMQFFKAEITPRQIKSEASHIASNIKHLMDKIESQILDNDLLEDSTDILLTDISSHSGGRSAGLQERLIQDEEERQETRVSRCFVM